MLGVELLAGFDQLIIHDVQITYGSIQMLMPQCLLDQLQPPSVFPAYIGKVPPKHMRSQINPCLFLHPFQHVIDAVHF